MIIDANPEWLKSVHHNGSIGYLSDLQPKIGDKVKLRLRIADDAPVKHVYLRTVPDGEQKFTPLTLKSKEPPCQWWETDLSITMPTTHYRFLIESEDNLWTYSAIGLTESTPLDYTDFRIIADYKIPSWVNSAVFYQIFPDRFANGNTATNPQPEDFQYKGFGPQTYDWGTPPDPSQPFYLIFYGGDLPGISQNLGHLDLLGVNALYLNPIFSAHSNHKYDVTDYQSIDIHFGGEKELVRLRQALTKRKMHYILDIVPNHCGYWHPWFQSALNDPHSIEAGFFTFQNHPEEYESWLGVWTLPKFNYKSLELRRRMYQDENAIFRRWLLPPFSADGWRVDVANMLGRQGRIQLGNEIVQGIRATVKDSNIDAFLMGENFFDATSQLQGDQWDSVMNYAGFTIPLRNWLIGVKEWSHQLRRYIFNQNRWSTMALKETLQNHLAAIPSSIAIQQFNILGSHDTPRIRSLLRENDDLHRLAIILQFTFPGVPCIYYGDEIGMLDDPNLGSRGCMIWDSELWDMDLFNFYQKIIRFRKNSTILQLGGFQFLAIGEDFIAYQRDYLDKHIIIIANRAEKPERNFNLSVSHGGIRDGSMFFNLFDGLEVVISDGVLSLYTHPQGATIWIEK